MGEPDLIKLVREVVGLGSLNGVKKVEALFMLQDQLVDSFLLVANMHGFVVPVLLSTLSLKALKPLFLF